MFTVSNYFNSSQKNTSRNDQCYCGSGKKNKKCCG
ncbi:SEC-C metal-binding domain-containing protein [Vibrio europaeus]